MQEIWKDIPWYEWLYQVSDLGDIFKLPDRQYLKWKILNKQTDKWWYKYVWLSNNIKRKMTKVHRLVALTFIPNPENKTQVNHINWIKYDNRVENLEWCTPRENIIHSFEKLWKKWSLLWKVWKLHHSSKQVKQYLICWKFIKTRESIWIINKELWFDISSISKCCNWKLKTAYKYIWKY